jgi:hypothetical protein
MNTTLFVTLSLKPIYSLSSFIGNTPIIELKTRCCDARIESILLDVNKKSIIGLRGDCHPYRPDLK